MTGFSFARPVDFRLLCRGLSQAALAAALVCLWCPAAPGQNPEPNWNIAQVRPVARIGLTAKAPVIDGLLADGEWHGLHVSRFVAQSAGGKDLLQPREGSYDLACDGETLFIAVQSAVHPVLGPLAKHKPLPNDGTVSEVIYDDSIELWFDTAPGTSAGNVYTIDVNGLGAVMMKSTDKQDGLQNTSWRPGGFKQAHALKDGIWTAEFAIPLRSLGVDDPGNPLGLRVCRNFKHPWDQSRGEPNVVAFDSPETMSRISFSPNAPHLRELGFQDADGIRVAVEVTNPGEAPMAVAGRLAGNAESQPRYGKDFVETLAAGATSTWEYRTEFFSTAGYLALAEIKVTSADGKEVFYHRDVKWQTQPGRVWDKAATAKAEDAFDFRIGWYPTPQLLHCRADYTAFKDRGKVESLRVVVTDLASGDVVAEKTLPAAADAVVDAQIELPALGAGDFQAGLFVDTEESASKAVKTLAFEHATDFPWIGERIGISEEVIPPFTPIEVDGNEAAVILRRYTFGSAGLPEQITSLERNILAGPVRLESLQDGKTVVASGTMTIPERLPHRATAKASWRAGALAGATTTELDYDGCLKVVLRVLPTDGKLIDALDLVVPLVDREMPLMHACGDGLRINAAGAIKAGQGTVWTSDTAGRNDLVGTFLPYLWVGGEDRGLCWFAASDRDWVVDPQDAVSGLTLERNGDTLNLRVRLVQVPTTLDREHVITFGLMATPAKPITAPAGGKHSGQADWRDIEFGFGNGDGLILGMCSYWGANLYDVSPASRDFTLVRKIAEAVKHGQVDRPYFEQYQRDFPAMKAEVNWSAQPRKARYVIPYTNLVGDFTGNREWRVYQDEWKKRSLDEYRAGKTGGGSIDFVAIPVPSRQDYLLHHYRELLKNGFDSIYWDNMFLVTNRNVVAGGGYRRPDGVFQGEVNIWLLRELAKRTAVLNHQLGKPNLNMPHMTNANIIPVFSWTGTALDWEWKYGDSDYQDRWRRDYVRAVSLGRQAGCIPVVLEGQTSGRPNAEWLERTLTGVALSHDLVIWQPPKLYVEIKNHLRSKGLGRGLEKGEPACRVHHYWSEQPVTRVRGADTSWIAWEFPDEVVLLVCDYGDGAAACEIAIDTGRVGLPAGFTAVDWERPTEKSAANDGTFVVRDLKKHDVRVFVIKK
jgi:hypothetical protein